jgi:acetyl esterase/lipase
MPDAVDPELAALIGPVAWMTYSDDTVAEMGALLVAGPPASTPEVQRVDLTVPGDPPVVVRVHRPTNVSGPAPAIFGIHGGGYVIGNRTLDDPRFERWCAHLGCVGVSVEYRLAGESPYPAALDDCHLALQWLFAHADELGVDSTRIGVSGTSAGGGLAAALALLTRDRGELGLRFQILEAPMIDDRQITPSSRQDGMPMWSRDANTYGWQRYLGDRYGTADVPAYAAAARATDLMGLPPTFVSVGTVDGLRDEGIEYAVRLNRADVPTELHVYAGAPHGFQMFAGTTLAERANRDLDEWLEAIFRR